MGNLARKAASSASYYVKKYDLTAEIGGFPYGIASDNKNFERLCWCKPHRISTHQKFTIPLGHSALESIVSLYGLSAIGNNHDDAIWNEMVNDLVANPLEVTAFSIVNYLHAQAVIRYLVDAHNVDLPSALVNPAVICRLCRMVELAEIADAFRKSR